MMTLEEARAKLRAAGLLVTIPIAPTDAVELSEVEEERLAHEAADTKSIADLIDEDREDRI